MNNAKKGLLTSACYSLELWAEVRLNSGSTNSWYPLVFPHPHLTSATHFIWSGHKKDQLSQFPESSFWSAVSGLPDTEVNDHRTQLEKDNWHNVSAQTSLKTRQSRICRDRTQKSNGSSPSPSVFADPWGWEITGSDDGKISPKDESKKYQHFFLFLPEPWDP